MVRTGCGTTDRQHRSGQPEQPGAAPPEASAKTYDNSVTIGVVGAYLPAFEGGRNYTLLPAPVAIGAVKGFAFLLTGNQLNVDVLRTHVGARWDLQAGPLAAINLNRNTLSWTTDPRGKQLGTIAPAAELGGFVGLARTGVVTSAYDILSVSASYRRDVSGIHDSYIIEPGITYFTPLSHKAAIAVYGSAKFVGNNYGRTYYGVTEAQSAATGLPAFTPGSGLFSWSTGIIGTHALTGDLLHGFKAVAGLGYSRVEGAFARAPLINQLGDRNQWLATAGLALSF